MTTGINGGGNGEQSKNSPSTKTAIQALFGDTQPSLVFRTETKTTPATALGLILDGTEKDWKNYANMGTETRNREINDLLSILYLYFNNPKYEWHEAGELSEDQQLLYNMVTTRLPQTTELTGVSAVTGKVRAQVLDGIVGRGNGNPGISVSVDIERYGYGKK